MAGLGVTPVLDGPRPARVLVLGQNQPPAPKPVRIAAMSAICHEHADVHEAQPGTGKRSRTVKMTEVHESAPMRERSYTKQHFLYFFPLPLPQGQGLLRPTLVRTLEASRTKDFKLPGLPMVFVSASMVSSCVRWE